MFALRKKLRVWLLIQEPLQIVQSQELDICLCYQWGSSFTHTCTNHGRGSGTTSPSESTRCSPNYVWQCGETSSSASTWCLGETWQHLEQEQGQELPQGILKAVPRGYWWQPAENTTKPAPTQCGSGAKQAEGTEFPLRLCYRQYGEARARNSLWPRNSQWSHMNITELLHSSQRSKASPPQQGY